ncbi:MAG: hypothetical protein WC614_07160 [bacterium]
MDASKGLLIPERTTALLTEKVKSFEERLHELSKHYCEADGSTIITDANVNQAFRILIKKRKVSTGIYTLFSIGHLISAGVFGYSLTSYFSTNNTSSQHSYSLISVLCIVIFTIIKIFEKTLYDKE